MKIELQNPCHESWVNMQPTKEGRFCDSCQKEVADFSQFTDTELKAYFAQAKGTGCGRFHPTQLNRILPNAPKKPRFMPKWSLSFLLFLGACTKETTPKEQINSVTNSAKELKKSKFSLFFLEEDVAISGIVQKEYRKIPLGGVEVRIKGTDFITLTNEEGKFELVAQLPSELQESLILVFSYPHDTREYLLNRNEFAETKVYYIELEADILKKGGYGIVETPLKKPFWGKVPFLRSRRYDKA